MFIVKNQTFLRYIYTPCVWITNATLTPKSEIKCQKTLIIILYQICNCKIILNYLNC